MSVRAMGVAAAVALAAGSGARADITYSVENVSNPTHESFNNSQGTETEDCWVANSFQAVAGGTHITQLQFWVGQTALTNQQVTIALYLGSSLTSPTGLSRVVASTTTTSVTAGANTLATLTFGTATDVSAGQIFYGAMLIRGVLGSAFPFSSDFGQPGGPAPLGRSFFDVGATQGAAYDLDVTTRATVLGGSHPVVTLAQDPGNLALRIVATPEPGVLALLGLGGIVVLRRRR